MLVSAYTSDLGDENERASGESEGRNPGRALFPDPGAAGLGNKTALSSSRLTNLIACEKYLPLICIY